MTDGYIVTGVLAEDRAGGIFRGLRRRDGAGVVVKFLRADLPSPREAERLRHEYEILRQLDGWWVPKPQALDRHQGQWRLVLEGFEGEPLSGLFYGPLDPGQFLDIAVRLTAAVVDLHGQGMVHGDLRPGNVLFDQTRGDLKLLGFGMTARLSDVPVAPARPLGFEGSPAYMSPEQTGYLNRGVDHRSDLYSLGVVFYELLTGAVPFQAADPAEWAHCHVARLPRPPGQVVPTLPAGLVGVVMKLLAKQPEERYQTARGLSADLQHCHQEWTTTGDVAAFPLGSHDVCERLLIPSRLYGREREASTLKDCFERVRSTGGTQLVLVSGYSGIGKSTLVQELRAPVVAARGYFASGKYDQHQRDIPYSTVVQAVQELLRQILSESEDRVQGWRAALLAALGVNGKVIVDLVPQLELLIGPQPPAPTLSPAEAQQRQQLMFGRFLGVFARDQHPLVLFLDDLQWLDPASLRLMTYLLTCPDIGALLLVGAYRDNEVGPSHPLAIALEKIRCSESSPEELELGPLPPAALTQFVADSLLRPPEAVAPLARLICDKTEGNPFFAIHFLATLHQEGLLFSRDDCWQWDLAAIRRQGFTDNVVELMLGKLGRLSDAARHALMLAACVANSVDATTLAQLEGRGEDELADILREAMDSGLLWRVEGRYVFLHDRVQEAAYALLAPAARPAQHLQIGRTLLAHTPQHQLAANIFDIVGQLNRGRSLITDPAERQRLAELNLIAAKRSKAATAHASALAYLTVGASLLSGSAWQSCYELTFALHVDRAECEYLVGNHAGSEGLLASALEHARSVLDRARAYRLRVRLYQLSGHLPEAMGTVLEALTLFGVTFPEDPEAASAATDTEIQLAYDTLRGRRIADLADAPLTHDPEVQAVIGLLAEAMPVTYVTRPSLWALVTARAVNVCLRHGHTEESPFVYSTYAMVLAGVRRDTPAAQQFSEMALQLNERLPNAAAHRGTLLLRHGSVITIWTRHFSVGLPLLEQAFDACLEAGDLVFAGYTTNNAIWVHLENGDQLDEVAALADRFSAFARQSNTEVIYHLDRLMGQFALSFAGRTRSLTDLSDEHFDEADSVAALERAKFGRGLAFYYIMKLIGAFHGGRFDEAWDWAERTTPILRQVAAIAAEATYQFYRALTIAALATRASAAERQELAGRLRQPLEMLTRWAGRCRENFADREALVRAELARLEGRDVEAMQRYEEAIASARENGFAHQEGLAFELASRFYRSHALDWTAAAHLRQARDCYARWGAGGKVRLLDEQDPDLVEGSALTPTGLFTARSAQVDLLSVVKASQAISQEIMLPQLQETLIRVALEHTGAQRGCLLLARDDGLVIHARAEVDGDQTRVDLLAGVRACAESVPMSLLNYVRHTGEAVVLADAGRDARYAGDAYFAEHNPRSVLGLPITRQGRLIGVLYLENDLVSGAFIADKLAVLELLAAQAAISLETAGLYADLQAENAERARAEEEARQLNRQLAFRAMHDDLTGLPNRALLMDHLQAALARAQRTGTAVGVLFIDLDDFKSVNDTFGHVTADGFLAHVGRRISGTLRETDTAARMGGDEFVVVCELTDPADAALVAQRIRSALSADIPVGGTRIGAPASIGIAVSTGESTANDLLREADEAMYKAKARGGRRWEPSDSFARTAANQMLEVEAQLREAIRSDQLRVYYQPTVNLRTARMTGVEALLRWQHPTRGLLLPQEMIHVAERRNLIGQIGTWVLQTACRQAAEWAHRYGLAAPALAVNVSSRQLGGQGLTEQVRHLLQQTDLPPQNLCLEITETQFVTVDSAATADLHALREAGVGIAVDDFGTGFAGFDYLRRLPATTLKIDKSYVQGLGINQADTAIAASVITLAHNLGLHTIAEGIETHDQRNHLDRLGCVDGQGWLWHPALPAESVEQLIRTSLPGRSPGNINPDAGT